MRYLKFYRLLRGLHQADLANLIGISQSYISYAEKGKRTLGPNSLDKIKEHLEFPLPSQKLLEVMPQTYEVRTNN